MSGGGPYAAKPMISAEDAASVIAGVSHIDALPLPFQYFVTYWYQHCPAGGVAPITVLDQPSAPPISFSGIIFRAEPSGAEKLNFRSVESKGARWTTSIGPMRRRARNSITPISSVGAAPTFSSAGAAGCPDARSCESSESTPRSLPTTARPSSSSACASCPTPDRSCAPVFARVSLRGWHHRPAIRDRNSSIRATATSMLPASVCPEALRGLKLWSPSGRKPSSIEPDRR
jgi:hypothetical protein